MRTVTLISLAAIFASSSVLAQDAVVVPKITDTVSGRPGGAPLNVIKLDQPADRDTDST